MSTPRTRRELARSRRGVGRTRRSLGRAECVWPVATRLGEGPVWAPREQALYWLDIKEPRVFRFAPASGARAELPVPEEIGCLALRRDGGLVAALRSGFAFLDLGGGGLRVEPIADPEAELPGNRFNDGKCDAAGRFWAGTMDDACEAPTGALYRLDPDRRVHRMDAGYVVTNGPAWSPDGRVMYHNDSMAGVIHAFDADPASGAIANRREFASLAPGEGYPDGLTVDAEGYVWCAIWDGWRVNRYAPDGTLDGGLELPVARPTSCAFGGADLCTLFVTSASIDLSAAELAAQPLAGGLFAAAVGARGLPAREFAG